MTEIKLSCVYLNVFHALVTILFDIIVFSAINWTKHTFRNFSKCKCKITEINYN